MNFIIFPGEQGSVRTLGGKAMALHRLHGARFDVPEWFAVTPEACESSRAGSAETVPSRPSAEVSQEVQEALRRIDPAGNGLFAVRSSAAEEDGAAASFAGQLESFLFVAHGDVPDRIVGVWASGFSERIAAYRREHGLSGEGRPPAVLVQCMVRAERSGVAFSADPVSGDLNVAVVTALRGMGTALVSGDADADTYRVDRGGVLLEAVTGRQHTMHVMDGTAPEGVSPRDVPPEMATRPVLSPEEAMAVAAMVREAERHFGAPQDIEWAMEAGRLLLLQSRPITTITPPGAGELAIWDNSNITESYSGVTTPLTFSFARRIYEHVYRQFCRLMRVPRAAVLAHDATFAGMLGLIRGRVYYNLLNWYRVLSLLPGYRLNRRFMEQMMGVRESLHDRLAVELGRGTRGGKMRDAVHVGGTVGGLLWSFLSLPRAIRRFYRRLDAALAAPDPPLDRRDARQLADAYRALEARLLTRWDAPLVNDFFAMIFFGLLGRLCSGWCRDTAGTLHNNLVCREGGMVSAEPARRIKEMAGIAAREPGLSAVLQTSPPEELLARVARHAAFREAYERYLQKFGDRCLEELKLESPTLYDDPLPLLRGVGAMAGRPASAGGEPAPGPDVRATAERTVARALDGRPFKRAIFGWVLAQARARIRDRENLRFERTRLFGRVRRIMLQIGLRFQDAGWLTDAGDVFYLELQEVLSAAEGSRPPDDLKVLASTRRARFLVYREQPAPPDRFETRGPVRDGMTYAALRVSEAPAGDARKGLGCCPGTIRARVRVIRDPRRESMVAGDILVAERTDPGWVMLFPSAAGLLVERGSLLSHSAIVAREMGIPAVVSVPGLLAWLRTGDWVEMDGATGDVRRLESSAGPQGEAGAARAQ